MPFYVHSCSHWMCMNKITDYLSMICFKEICLVENVYINH
jgi:hypothetical protein